MLNKSHVTIEGVIIVKRSIKAQDLKHDTIEYMFQTWHVCTVLKLQNKQTSIYVAMSILSYGNQKEMGHKRGINSFL